MKIAKQKVVEDKYPGHPQGAERCAFVRNYYYVNKPEWPSHPPESDCSLFFGSIKNKTDWTFVAPWGAIFWFPPDVPNLRPFYDAIDTSWNEQLYASAYARFMDAARQGSAEMGLTILEWRKALSSFINVSVAAAAVSEGIRRTWINALTYLRGREDMTPKRTSVRIAYLQRQLDKKVRDANTRRRLQNELWILEQVSSLFLAYRYGLAPLMDDLYSAATILSKEYDGGVSLRKSGKTSWAGREIGAESKVEWTGSESVVLRATADVSNPNLLLANRLGLINPASIVWEMTPWSFLIDWWINIGGFLDSLTASAGLTFRHSSVTRTRAWVFTHHRIVWQTKSSDGYGKRKVRSAGPLPPPVRVPWGTGLNIQRGQNALALVVQNLSPRLRKLTRLS